MRAIVVRLQFQRARQLRRCVGGAAAALVHRGKRDANVGEFRIDLLRALGCFDRLRCPRLLARLLVFAPVGAAQPGIAERETPVDPHGLLERGDGRIDGVRPRLVERRATAPVCRQGLNVVRWRTRELFPVGGGRVAHHE